MRIKYHIRIIVSLFQWWGWGEFTLAAFRELIFKVIEWWYSDILLFGFSDVRSQIIQLIKYYPGVFESNYTEPLIIVWRCFESLERRDVCTKTLAGEIKSFVPFAMNASYQAPHKKYNQTATHYSTGIPDVFWEESACTRCNLQRYVMC